MRRASKRDIAEPEVIEGLESEGAIVIQQDRPVDLDVWYRNCWYKAEVKTPGARPDKRQKEQAAFVKAFGIPILRTKADAVNWVRRLPDRRESFAVNLNIRRDLPLPIIIAPQDC